MTTRRAILLGGLTVGALDGLDAIIFFGLRGVSAERIFRGIAAGLVGREAALAGGWGTLLLGLALHFSIATAIVTVMVLAARRFPALVARPFLAGPLYGIAAWLVMNLVVMPLSATGRGPFVLVPVINGLLIHMLGVGTPAVLFARRAIPASPSPRANPPPVM